MIDWNLSLVYSILKKEDPMCRLERHKPIRFGLIYDQTKYMLSTIGDKSQITAGSYVYLATSLLSLAPPLTAKIMSVLRSDVEVL